MHNRNRIKRLLGAGLLLLGLAVQSSVYADEAVLQAFINTRDTSPTLTLGRTRNDLSQCIKWADELGIPLIGIWSNEGCAHCERLERAMTSEAFLAHAKKSGFIICAVYNSDGKGTITQSDPEGVRNGFGYQWCWGQGNSKIYKSISMFPFVRFYWKKDGKQIVDTLRTGDQVDGNTGTDTSTGTMTDEFGTYATVAGKTANKAGVYTIQYMQKMFPGYVPVTLDSYTGGAFADPDTAGNRLEFESGTTSVKVNLSRQETNATNVLFKVTGPTGAELKSEKVDWAAGETEKTVEIALTSEMKSACGTDGQQLTLYLVDNGKNAATNHITFVKREPSAANPLWIGERKDPYANGIVPDLSFGEWTADLDLAKQVVKKTAGDAYTLVSIQGSMWCPDCANTDRNFLEAKDGSGNNRFCAWAKAHNVALVSMDVPNYSKTGPTPDTVASPTLFSKNAFETTLARAGEYPQSGAPEEMTKPVSRSGLGYLTRKGATDAQAAEVMRKFHDLAVTNTDQGGFHRPEDTNLYRTGVPIFVLLRKDGSVAARFTRFAAKSPMSSDRANFDNYIKRFEEMLALAASSGAHADAGEIANNYPGDGAISFKANGGTASNELCNADFQDAFKLTGVGGNADQQVTVTGASDAQVSVRFWQKAADGSFTALGTEAKGKLRDGVNLMQSFTAAGDYYVLVKGVDITASEFDAASSVADHFIAYEVKGSAVFAPQEDRATAKAPEGSDMVTVKLEKDVVYCMTGVTAEDNPSLVQVAEASPFRFLKATESGAVELKISTGLGGEITYQIWNPGKIGFVEKALEVPESVNDLEDDWVEFKIARQGGKSGRIKARVTIDASRTTADKNRVYLFETNTLNAADFVWEDGVESNMIARVKIEDDEFFDGDYQIAFNLEVLASDADDVTVVEGGNSFVLTVVEDDKDTPGRVMINAVEPDYAKKGTVYIRESDNAKIWVERIEAASGLVKAEIVSSVAGTTFATENPRDMTNDNGRVYIWWSSREMTEKYVQVGNIPVGKTAKIQIKSVGGFEAVPSSNSVTIVSIADDAPQFTQSSYAFDLYRYFEAGESVKASIDATMLKGGKVSFTKLSGTVPAGLKAVYDEEKKEFAFTGKVTAKAGTYSVVYQVSETRAGKRVPGMMAEFVFTVIDPTDPEEDPKFSNPSVQVTRTLKDIAIVNPETKRMVGVLQLTIPAKGNLSGKYVCESGTIALTTKSWSDFDLETRALSAELSNAKSDIRVNVTANANFSVSVTVDDPSVAETVCEGYAGGWNWSADTSVAWKGYYTVSLPVENVVSNATANLVSTGAGYLALDFTSKGAMKSGAVKWAGILPNGVAVSGSTVLGSPYSGKSAIEEGCRWADLAIFKKSSTDTLSACLKIRDDADTEEVRASDRRVIWAADDVTSFWKHGERSTGACDSDVDLGVYGAIYDKSEDLGACCLEYYKTQSMVLAFDVSELVWTAGGEPQPIPDIPVEITETKLAGDAEALKAAGVTMSFNRSTGIVSGTAKVHCADKVVNASYKGVVMTGWGESCCGVSAGLKMMPFVNGAFFFTDNVVTDGKKVSVKRGGAVAIDVAE